MKYNYVIKDDAPVIVEETITVSLEKAMGDFNLVLQKADGSRRTVLGLRPGSKGLVAVRWTSGFSDETFGVDRDSAGRIVDLFKNDK
jgi:hypothetical protein